MLLARRIRTVRPHGLRALSATTTTPPPAFKYEHTDKVKKLVGDFESLSVLEVCAFTELLQFKLGFAGVDLANLGMGGGGGGSAAAAPAAAAAAAPAAPAVAEKTTFDLKLDGFEAADKIKVIKLVREITGLGLKEVSLLCPGRTCCVYETDASVLGVTGKGYGGGVAQGDYEGRGQGPSRAVDGQAQGQWG